MAQSFRALLAEQDAEYVYHIKSPRHLHDDDIFDKLQIGMLGYDLRSLERVSYNPLAAVEPMFHPRNDEPGLDNIFHVRVVLGTDIPMPLVISISSCFSAWIAFISISIISGRFSFTIVTIS